MLKNNKTLIIIILSSILLIAGGYFLLIRKKKTNNMSAIKAVPINPILIFKSKDIQSMLDNFSEKNKLWTEFTNIKLLNKYNENINKIKQILETNEDVDEFLKDKPFLISLYKKGESRIEFLFISEIGKTIHSDKIKKFIKNQIGYNAHITEKVHNDRLVYSVSFDKDKDKNFTYTFVDGVLLFSKSTILLEESIRQIDGNSSLLSDADFKKVANTATDDADANLYLNYPNFSVILSNYMNTVHKKYALGIKDLGQWSEADIEIKDNSISLNGFTYTNSKKNKYLSIFLRQSPISIDIEKILPANTTNFITFGIDDFTKFKTDYKHYLESCGTLSNYEDELKSLEKKYKINIEDIFYKILKDEIGLFYTKSQTENQQENKFAILRVVDKKEAVHQINEILNRHSEFLNVDPATFINPFETDEDKYTIYKAPIVNIPKKLFGELFDSTRWEYLTIIDDYMVFANQIYELKQFIRNLENQKTLYKSKSYRQFSNSISSRSNVYFYSKVKESYDLYSSFLKNNLKTKFKSNFNTFSTIEAIAVKFKSNNDMIFNDVFIKYNPTKKHAPKTQWECKLNANSNFKPAFFTNHYTSNKEVVVQDLNNNIYLIGTNSKILWKRQVDGKIISDIHEIDFYKNGKIQMMFNTPNSIYMIDRNGNKVKGFPKKLESPATNGISVFDYDKDKTYRIFYATQDGKVNLIDKNGSKIKGWKFNKTRTNVFSPIQFVRSNQKDYIIFSDETKTYILNRKGKTRIRLKQNFIKSKNNPFIFEPRTPRSNARFIATSPNGEVFYLYLNGEVRNIKIKDFSHQHYFNYSDLNNDGKGDFVFAHENMVEVYERDKTKLFEHKLNGDIKYRPQVYEFSATDKKIGFIDATKSEVYLLNSDGSIYPGFPKAGNSMFTIGTLQKGKKFSLIVASSKNSIYNYKM